MSLGTTSEILLLTEKAWSIHVYDYDASCTSFIHVEDTSQDNLQNGYGTDQIYRSPQGAAPLRKTNYRTGQQVCSLVSSSLGPPQQILSGPASRAPRQGARSHFRRHTNLISSVNMIKNLPTG
jgi:hypothetical protein